MCICGLFTTVRAAEATPKIYTLTLDEAVNMALEDNPQLESLAIKKKSIKINLDDAVRTKYNYRNAPISTSGYDVVYIKEGYYVDTYKMMERLNEKETEKAMETLVYEVTESYFNCKIADALCDIAQNAYDLANENLDNVTKRYELGMIAKIDLDNAAVNVESVKNALDSYKRNAQIAKDNLKIKLQLDGEECDFVLTDEIDYTAFEADIDADIEKAMGNRYDVTALKESYELAEDYFEYTKGLTESSAKYQTAYSSLVEAEYSYTNNKRLIALSIRAAYNQVLNCADSLTTAEKSASIAKQKYEINKVKFESGMITNSDLTQSLNDYLSADISLENAKLSYKLAVTKYNADIKIGI